MIGNDLTRGPVTKTLLSFTLPFVVANVLHTLYGIVDLFIVGRFTDSMQMSAVSVGSMIMLTINMIVSGLGTGGTVLTGQMCGAGKKKDVDETVSTIFCVVPLFAVALMVLCLCVRNPFLRLLHTPEESFAATEAYVRICLFGLVFTGMFNAISAVLRGMGDSKGPTFFIGGACILNIIGDVICVKFLGWGAAGAAFATSAAQGCSVVLGYFYLKRRNFPFDFHPRSFRIYKDKLRRLIRIGTPTALQETMTNISFLVLEAIVNKMGYISSAAAGVADRIFSVAIVPAVAFSAAISAMVAQNIGAGQYARGRKCLRIGLLFSGAISFLLFLIMAIIPDKVIGLFTTDAEVIRNATDYMFFYKFDMLLFSFAFCTMGYINGTGHTRYTMTVNLISSFAVRLPIIWAISRMAGVTLYHIGSGLPSASIVQLSLCFGFVLFARSERAHRKMPETPRAE